MNAMTLSVSRWRSAHLAYRLASLSLVIHCYLYYINILVNKTDACMGR
jgi:hypothetical protein